MSTPARIVHTPAQRPLDQIDRRIVEQLQREARLTNVELSQRVHLSPSPCLARVRALEQTGVIERYVALADPRALGLTVCAFIHVTLDRQVDKALEVFEHSVRSRPEILECYLMTGDHDYVLRVVVQNVEELQHFIVAELSRVPGVANIRSSLALKEVKYETALPIEHDTHPISSKAVRPRR
jgi:Lrp/AsnC family transcriptional regulator, leucine-responsive regulatory protein